jgi:arylsulfatase A-like enzyme
VATEPFFLFFHIYEPHAPHQPPEPYASRYESPYDGEVAAADAVVGELLRQLRAAELYDRSLILLLSDHGEGLYDHGDYEHGLLLYREALQIPLLLKLPFAERGGSTVERPVGLIDVLPTLLELLDVEVPAELPGRSLLSAAKEND